MALPTMILDLPPLPAFHVPSLLRLRHRPPPRPASIYLGMKRSIPKYTEVYFCGTCSTGKEFQTLAWTNGQNANDHVISHLSGS